MISQGRLLLVRRAAWLHGGPGQWAIPGGALRAREETRAGAWREFTEEMGSRPRHCRELGAHVADIEPGQWQYTTFVVEVDAMHDYTATLSDEHDEYVWAHRDELHRLVLFAPFAAALPALLEIADVALSQYVETRAT